MSVTPAEGAGYNDLRRAPTGIDKLLSFAGAGERTKHSAGARLQIRSLTPYLGMMTMPSSVEITLERLSAQAGAPLFRRLIRRGDRILAAFAVWCHRGGDFDLTDLRTTQLVLALTGGQQADLFGATSHRYRVTTAGDVSFVVPAVLPRVKVTGRAGTLQVVLADELIAAARQSAGTRRENPRPLAAQALVALRAGADDARCGEIALRIAHRFAASGALEPAYAHSRAVGRRPARGGLAPSTLRHVCDLMRTRLIATPDRLPACGELAARAALSEFHFIRAFRDSTGLTPHAWLMERRIERAYALLLEDGAMIGDVAEQTGFSSPAHFVSTFRSRNGLTPATLRDSASALLAVAA